MQFEDFLSEFSTDFINHKQFLLNAILTAIMTYLLGLFYTKYGSSIANRKKFGDNFMLLALATMLIIYIVKSSIALSLGLVGALSIVRFRAAIKEPEELIYLFFTIGIGLGMGANQPIITILSYVLIMAILIIKAMIARKQPIKSPESMIVNISTKALDMATINSILSDNFQFIELRRMDHFNGRLDASFIIEAKEVAQIIKAKDQLIEKSAELNFSFIEQRNLAV